jgi:hypothetical protein
MLGRLLKELLESRSRSRPAQAAFEAGVAAYEAGNHPIAAEHFASALRADPEHVQAHRYSGAIAFVAGCYRVALDHFEQVRRFEPGNAQSHFDAAMAHWKLDATGAARECCETALALDPVLNPALEMLASLTLPGTDYSEFLPMIHSHLRPRTYLEIGVETGRSIALARPETRAIGIDPEPRIEVPLGPRTSIVAMTSDDYFTTRDVHADLGGLPIDLAFIDGMHRFEFALRDFVNIEKYAAPLSTVLIHDCYPLNRLTAERERHTVFWSGDIWRFILVLRKYRPDLSVNVIATAPTGLGVVRRLDPASKVLGERLEEIGREFLALDYSVLDADKAGMLALFPNDWEKIKAILQ